MDRTLIAVCAAGRSSRMGDQDKLALNIGDEPMLRRIVRHAMDTTADVAVFHSPSHASRHHLTAGLPVRTIITGRATYGLSGTLKAAVNAAADYSALMIVLADMPALTSLHMSRMLRARRENPKGKIWRAVTKDGATGHPILFDKSMFSAFSTLEGDEGAKSILNAHKKHVVDIPFPGTAVALDIDTPQDAKAFLASLAA